jgi:hypothetical protein
MAGPTVASTELFTAMPAITFAVSRRLAVVRMFPESDEILLDQTLQLAFLEG